MTKKIKEGLSREKLVKYTSKSVSVEHIIPKSLWNTKLTLDRVGQRTLALSVVFLIPVDM